MMNDRVFLPEVSQAIEEYFKQWDITQAMAAKLLGVTPQAVSLQLRKPFGKNASSKWSRQFGFNREFLMTGKGELRETPALSPSEQQAYDAANLSLTQLRENEKEENEIGETVPEELQKEDEHYRRIDIDSYIYNFQWDTEKDYNAAIEISEIFRVQTGDLIDELSFLQNVNKMYIEEYKKLVIENGALRRLNKKQ